MASVVPDHCRPVRQADVRLPLPPRRTGSDLDVEASGVMARAVYIKRGPAHRLLGPAALAICAAGLWLLWQACRLASRYRGATITAAALLTVWLLVGDWMPVL